MQLFICILYIYFILTINSNLHIEYRSTEKLSLKKFGLIITMLESSSSLDRYNRERSRDRKVKFTTVRMVSIILWMEIKMTFADLEQMCDGRGSQRILANLGMPMRNGRYIRPFNGWIADFGNHDYFYFRYELWAEVVELVVSRNNRYTLYACDFTPLKANRYSEWADYNIHYGINMIKEHIVMKDGKSFLFTTTNSNKDNNPKLRKLLKRMDSTRNSGCFLVDGGHNSR